MRTSEKRNTILAALKKGGVYTAAELHEKLPTIDRVTVYRNLAYFVKEGIVKELRLKKDTISYEYEQEQHQHAVCEECGKIYHVNIDPAELKKLIPQIDFEIDHVELVIKGHCK